MTTPVPPDIDIDIDIDIDPALDNAHETERALMRITGTEHHEPGFSVYQSRRFPRFFDGNCLEIRDARTRDLTGWIDVFRAHFDRDTYRHMTLFALDGSGVDTIVPDARRQGFQVTELRYLLARVAPEHRPLSETLTIHTVDSQARWQMMAAFDDRENRNASWYTPEGQAMLHERKRLISREANITWRYVSPRDEDRILAKLGMFEHREPRGRACRLQDVVTAPAHRRQGLARVLVGQAIAEACDERCTRGLYVCADADDVAINLYRQLGFEDIGKMIQLFLAPSAALDSTPTRPD